MFLLRKPDDRRLRQIMDGYRDDQPSYLEIGHTRGQLPKGYHVDHHRIQLGASRETFERARRALYDGQMFRLNWLEPCWPRQPVKEGVLVGTLARVGQGKWTADDVARALEARDRAAGGPTAPAHALYLVEVAY